MPRSGRLRNFIKELSESPRIEKISFIPPFLVLAVEIILLHHAITIKVYYVIELTIILVILSLIEIFFVAEEIHEHYIKSSFERILTIRLDDFILERKNENVKTLVEEFIHFYPVYKKERTKIYHIACEILETHKEELWQKELRLSLEKFVKRHKKKNIRDLVRLFIKKHPHYQPHAEDVYRIACQLLENNTNK